MLIKINDEKKNREFITVTIVFVGEKAFACKEGSSIHSVPKKKKKEKCRCGVIYLAMFLCVFEPQQKI